MGGRCEGEAAFKAFQGASEDLIRNLHGVADRIREMDVKAKRPMFAYIRKAAATAGIELPGT
jgi:hypothetical protein